MNWLEIIAVIFGFICVWLTIRQNIWSWPAGLVQVILYVVIFHRVKLYSDMGLQAIYVVLQFYGWYHWLYGGEGHSELKVSRLAWSARLSWLTVAIVGTALWGWGMASFTDAAVPYVDAFTTVASLVAQWLMTRKRLESWIFWITVDVVSIGIYLYKGLALTAGLYAAFLIMATMGLFAWRRSELKHKAEFENENGTHPGQIRAVTQGASMSD